MVIKTLPAYHQKWDNHDPQRKGTSTILHLSKQFFKNNHNDHKTPQSRKIPSNSRLDTNIHIRSWQKQPSIPNIGIINKENNQYQLQMEKHGQLITKTLEPNSAWEFKPHFQSRTTFRSRINRNYNQNHDNNISYAHSKPQVTAFIPSNIPPKNKIELQHSKNTNPMEYPKGIIINGDRLREILLIKEHPEKRCGQLCDTHKQDLQTLTNKLINLYQTEHEEKLSQTHKQLRQTQENIRNVCTALRKKPTKT